MAASSLTQASKRQDCTALAAKVVMYCGEVARREGRAEHMPELAAYARELEMESDRGTLLALSREVDVCLREAHEPAVSLAVVAAMQASGVPGRYLPVLPSAKRLRGIAERGVVSTALEASLVRSVMESPWMPGLLREHFNSLSAALDGWQSRVRT
jgi:hypothetical protein